MRKLFYLLLAISIGTSCEDVIEVDVPVDRPRLTVDAVFRLDDLLAAEQTVQVNVGLTSGFFDDIQTTTLEAISLVNPSYEGTGPQDSNVLELVEVAAGIYEGTKATAFFTEGTLQLLISHLGDNFLAETSFVPTSDIDELVQGDGTLFGGDETEVIIAYTDEPNRDDFYFFDFGFNEFLVSEDVFYRGQRFSFSFFYDEEVSAGTEIDVSLIGVDEAFYNYLNQVIVQADSGSAGPFQTPAATVRGNIINVTDIENIDSNDNFALGYFAIGQTFTESITLE